MDGDAWQLYLSTVLAGEKNRPVRRRTAFESRAEADHGSGSEQGDDTPKVAHDDDVQVVAHIRGVKLRGNLSCVTDLHHSRDRLGYLTCRDKYFWQIVRFFRHKKRTRRQYVDILDLTHHKCQYIKLKAFNRRASRRKSTRRTVQKMRSAWRGRVA